MQPNEKGTQKDLVLYRIETSKSDIKAAEILLAAKEFRGANNRAYYGIYHAISAVHALDGNAYKRHKDALANFNKNYVKTEIFPRKLGKKIVESEEIRHASDYDDFYIATREEAEEQIKRRLFITVILPLLKPVLATTGILSFMWVWNELQIPMYLLNSSSKWTLPLSVYNFYGQYSHSWNLVCADVVLVSLPVILVYIFAQKWVIEGMTAGAVKG